MLDTLNGLALKLLENWSLQITNIVILQYFWHRSYRYVQ